MQALEGHEIVGCLGRERLSNAACNKSTGSISLKHGLRYLLGVLF